MHRVVSFLFGMLIAGPILAADLGKPAPAPAAQPAPVPDMWTAPYLELGFAGQFAKGNEKNAALTVGLGYTYHALGNPWTPGAFARIGASLEGFDDSAILRFDQPISAGVTLGYLVSPSTRVYGIAGYAKALDTDFAGPMLGLGVSLPVFGNLRLGGEYTALFDRNFKADKDVVTEFRALMAIPF